jgi:DNA-binding transcriptional MerR regulator
VPQCTVPNRRVYNPDDIYRLQLLKKAVECGLAISHIASLENEKLGSQDSQTPNQISKAANGASRSDVNDYGDVVTEALGHVASLDPIALEKVLQRDAVKLPRPHFKSCRSALLPKSAGSGRPAE